MGNSNFCSTVTSHNGCCSSINTLTNDINSLAYTPAICINCGLCSIVCPQAVFRDGKKHAILANPKACMECGACQQNCPVGAIRVDSGVGCASAMIMAAIKGQEEACCGEGGGACCG